MLAHHNADDVVVPHHRGTVPTGFEVVVNLLALVGTFHRGATLVNEFPLLGPAKRLGKHAEIVTAERVVGSTILGGRTAAGRRATPLPTVLGLVKTVGSHFITLGTKGNAGGRNLHFAARCRIFHAPGVEINERLHVVSTKKLVNRFGVVSGIQEHFVHRAQGESLLKFGGAQDQADPVMLRGGLESGIER